MKGQWVKFLSIHMLAFPLSRTNNILIPTLFIRMLMPKLLIFYCKLRKFRLKLHIIYFSNISFTVFTWYFRNISKFAIVFPVAAYLVIRQTNYMKSWFIMVHKQPLRTFLKNNYSENFQKTFRKARPNWLI